MRNPIPRDTRGSGGDVREAARAAARREGMDVTQWIAQAVGHYAAQLGIDPAQLNEDERIEAIAGKLRRAAGPVPPHAKSRLPRVEGWFGRAGKSRVEDAGAESVTDAAVNRVLKRLENRADVDTLTHRIDQLEAELVEGAPSGALQPIRGALARLEARLESLAETAGAPSLLRRMEPADPLPREADDLRVESKPNSLMSSLASSVALPDSTHNGRPADQAPPKHRSLGAAIAEITRHQRALDEIGGASSIEGRGAQSASSQNRDAPEGSGEPGQVILESLHRDIATLVGKVDEVRREQTRQNASPPVCNLDKLRGEIATMSDALRDLASRGSTGPLEAAIRNLTEQIEMSRSDGAREAVLQPLEHLVADLRLALAEVDPRTTIRGLESEVKKLGGKLDNLGKCGLDTSALGAIDNRTRQIQEILSATPAQSAPIERLDRNIEALAERFDRMRDLNDAREPAAPPENSDLQAVADELRRLMDDQGRAALGKIETQLEAIAAKVDEALSEARDESRYTALGNRIDDVHRELAGRLSQIAPQLDMHVLEDLVRGLADKMEEARAAHDDGGAIEALQMQVSEFAARLDQTAAGSPSLTSLERSIGELFTELERTREISSAAAERAARGVLEEMLARTATSADRPDVARDLVELRTIQDEAGRRTFATLNAVHETLEKVVDRLAMVESEIADVRVERPAELLASGPVPMFAPAPGRETASSSQPFVPTKGAAAAERPRRDQQGDSLDDFLIEPGRGFPSRRDSGGDISERKAPVQSSDVPDMSEASSDRAGFIAAARRAAQAAQMESTAALGRDASRAGGGASDSSASLVEQTRNFIAHHKRPVVLSIAALFLVVGAYAVVKTVGHSPLDLSLGGGKNAPASPARLAHRTPEPSRRAVVPGPAKASPAAKPAAAASPGRHVSGGPQAIPGSDPIVTGSIGTLPKTAIPATSAVREVAPSVLLKLARAGDAKAQYALADAYESGRELSREPKIAAEWFEKAAGQNLAPAQYRLGSLYEKGLGVKRDIDKATALYRKAAEHGNVRAMHNLAVLSAEGGRDGKPDYTLAAQWFRKAAEYGIRDSQYNLAILLARGLGVSQNLPLSYTWFAIAASQGDEDSAKKRDDVGTHLGAADLAAAKATAAAFHPKTPDAAANEVRPPQGGTPSARTTAAARSKVSRL